MGPRMLASRMAAAALLALSLPAAAEHLMMARSVESFPEAMLTLQTTIGEHGYTVSRVQRVDIGLTASGYATDKYRIVFFGKPAEVRQMTRTYPQMIPYLPLKMTIFAEGEETVVVTANPVEFGDFVPSPEAQELFARWHRDIRSMLDTVRDSGR